MNDRRRLFFVAVFIFAATAFTAGISIYTLYRASLTQQRNRLRESAQSQARLIEEIVRARGTGSGREAVAQIIAAHRAFQTYGETGEYVLARKERGEIVFAFRYRHNTLELPAPVSLTGNLAEPMRRALAGESGTIEAYDYRGRRVLAAHEPVALADHGIVVKIDLTELRAPFLKAAGVTALTGFFVFGLGAAVYFFIINPMILTRQESEEKYRRLFEAAGDMFFLRDPESGRLLDVNNTGCQLLGRSRDDLLSRDFHSLLASQRDMVGLERVFAEALRTGSATGVSNFRRKDGTEIEMDIRCTPLSIAGKELILGIGRDLTAQRQLERRSHVFYQAFRNSQDSMFFTDRDGVLQDVNDAFIRRFGYRREEAVGKTPRIVRSTHTKKETYQSMWRDILDPAKGHWQGRITNRAKGGEEIPVMLSITGVRDEEGEILGFVSSAVDLSGLEELQRRLATSESLAAVGSMAAVVAHEIRNPLGSIVTAAASISRGDLEPEDRRVLLEIVRKESKRLNDTLTQFLQYARPRDLKLAAADLNETVREVLRMIRSDEKALGEIRIGEDLDGGLPRFGMDADQIRQVIWNIVLNALQAMEGDGDLTVSTAREDGRVVLRIKDTGPGIPEEELERIFEPFHTTKQKGSGLGLAVAERIVSAHGGSIRVDSEPGRGTDFSIHLPMGEEEPTA